MLYLGRMVLEPLAIAVLLAFVLAPPIRQLRRWHFGRVTSVIVVVVFALGVIGALGFVMETEITRFAGEIPQYQSNLREKIASLNKALVSSGTLKRASATLNNLAEELKVVQPKSPGEAAPEGARNAQTAVPVPVEIQTPKPATLDYLQNLLSPLVTPVTMGGLLILFLVFILFYREDLRDRVLRLAGTGDLQRTTAAMDDAGKRLSRFFLIQSAINGLFGTFIGSMLWLIGVPNPVLWGMLAGILRFVPYVGTPIAAVFPLLLASAIDPGWTKVLETAALFFVTELITGQAIEPILQGQLTGLSPVAIVIAQLFWTLVWGIPGLLLAVPITVCIAVAGKHIDALNFLGVVLGDEPALAPHEGFYQRVLAGDATEATFQAEGQLATEPLSDYYDGVPMKALALAQADAANGRLSQEKQLELCDTIEEVVEDLAEYTDDIGAPQANQRPGSEPDPSQAVPSSGNYPILLIAARSALDQSASLLLADILRKRELEPSIQSYSAARRRFKPAAAKAKLVCVSCFGAHSPVSMRYLIRRWERLIPGARFVACFWFLAADAVTLQEWRTNVGADFIATSLKETADICSREAALEHFPALDHGLVDHVLFNTGETPRLHT
jgi:predicted PurR-regulated permease PerM